MFINSAWMIQAIGVLRRLHVIVGRKSTWNQQVELDGDGETSGHHASVCAASVHHASACAASVHRASVCAASVHHASLCMCCVSAPRLSSDISPHTRLSQKHTASNSCWAGVAKSPTLRSTIESVAVEGFSLQTPPPLHQVFTLLNL